MKLDKVLNVAIADNLLVKVFYKLGNKDLGEYIIRKEFPHTLLLHPIEPCCSQIWIPNPRALDYKYIVTTWDDKSYIIDLYEPDGESMTHIWKLTLNCEDLTCLK